MTMQSPQPTPSTKSAETRPPLTQRTTQTTAAIREDAPPPYGRRQKLKTGRVQKYQPHSLHKTKMLPIIQLQGFWLEKAGFHIDAPYRLEVYKGRLVISLDTAATDR